MSDKEYRYDKNGKFEHVEFYTQGFVNLPMLTPDTKNDPVWKELTNDVLEAYSLLRIASNSFEQALSALHAIESMSTTYNYNHMPIDLCAWLDALEYNARLFVNRFKN